MDRPRAGGPRVTRPDGDKPIRSGMAKRPELGASAKPVVRLEQLTKRYTLDRQIITALKDVTLNIDEGVFLAIAGPSGSGKSTLLNLIGCLDTPSAGSLWIDDENVAEQTPDQLAGLRGPTIGFIFQTFTLFPVLTAAENVEYPLLKRADISPSERRARAFRHLKL